MLYTIAHYLRDKLPWLWELVNIINSTIFSLRYGKKLKKIENTILTLYSKNSSMTIIPMSQASTDDLVRFFTKQPQEAYTFFKPHGFDAKSINQLKKNKSFLAYILLENKDIAAYCFIRSFFHSKGFRGRMVGINHRGKGLGTLMNKMINDIGFGIGLQLFETVSKANVASYRSALSASNVRILNDSEDEELYLEILPEEK